MKEKEFTYFENNYWCGFKEGEAEDAKDVIYIDGFPEDDGEGAVVVKVWILMRENQRLCRELKMYFHLMQKRFILRQTRVCF